MNDAYVDEFDIILEEYKAQLKRNVTTSVRPSINHGKIGLDMLQSINKIEDNEAEYEAEDEDDDE